MAKLAEVFLDAWNLRSTRISAASLARRLDPDVFIKTHVHPFGFTFEFSDDSFTHTEGSGANFKIWNRGE
jgi:hypothetical protein